MSDKKTMPWCVECGAEARPYCNCDGYWDDCENSPEEEAIENCGIGPDGCCSLAGTEHCDFDCPFRDGGHPCL